MRRSIWFRIPAFCAVALVFLSLASYLTAQFLWDGDVPPGEYRILVTDQKGAPIPNAVLQIYEHRSHTAVYEYPIYESRPDSAIMSDENGLIVCHVTHEVGTSGSGSYLFWFIPIMMEGGSGLDIEIAADGYHPRTFDVAKLTPKRVNPEDIQRTTFLIDGDEVDFMVFEQQFKLKSKR